MCSLHLSPAPPARGTPGARATLERMRATRRSLVRRYALFAALVAGVPALACGDSTAGPGPLGGAPTTSTPATAADASASPSATARDGGAPDSSPPPTPDAATPPGSPPFGGSSGGTGGPAGLRAATMTAGAVSYRLTVPAAYSAAKATPLLVVYSGTEGGAVMAQNLVSAGPSTGSDGFIEAVLDGVAYRGNGAAGATVMDAVRASYNIDNDRTYLLGESAGTTAALDLGLRLRQPAFAAYWANDVNARATPQANAQALGFQPFGQAGPGGDLADAEAIVAGMRAAGYRLDAVSPYAGPGSTTHGATEQFLAALRWFSGKARR